MFLTKVAIHNINSCRSCFSYFFAFSVCTANFIKKVSLKKKLVIIIFEFFDEFKDLWKMKGTYFFVKNELLDPKKTLICPIGQLKSANKWLKKALRTKIWVLNQCAMWRKKIFADFIWNMSSLHSLREWYLSWF